MEHPRKQQLLPIRILRKALRLRAADVALVGRMLFLLGRYTVLRSRLPLPKLISEFDAGGVVTARTGDVHRLVRLVDALMRATYRDEYCMKRSLLLFHFLRRWGYDADIHFGVMKQDGRMKGHAWVEIGGVPLAEQGDPRVIYARTYSYPPRS